MPSLRKTATKSKSGSDPAGSGGSGPVVLRRQHSATQQRSTSSLLENNKMEPAHTAANSNIMNAVNPEIFQNFEKSGKNEFLKFIKQQLKDGDCPVLGSNETFKFGISSAIYDLLWHGLRCTLKKDTVLNVLHDAVALHADFSSLILDIINILDAETSLITDGIQEERLLFTQILRDLDKVIPDKLIKERLEIDTLQDVGIVKNKVFYTKFIKIKTKLYYKQRRFNLFREESEGYGKLITELNQDFEDDITPDSVMNMVKSLIGCFNLDPNRVLDIIIESFETRPERWQLFIPLLRAYMPTGTIICELLGYKFRYFAETDTPKSLSHVTALLLKYGVIDLNDIYVWLTPTDRIITTEWEQELADAREYVRKLNVIVTNKEREGDEDTKTYTAFNESKYKSNQKFGLCEALLNIGDWENAYKIIQKLPEQAVVVNKPIARALSDLIHTAIEIVYTKKCLKITKRKKTKFHDDPKLLQKLQARDFSDLRKYAIPMIVALGPSMHHDTVLMYKMIRICIRIAKDLGIDSLNTPTPNTESEKRYYEVMTIIDSAILPSLSYLDGNCPMAEEIWGVVRYFPYHFRFSLYARWKNESYQLHPMMIRRRGDAQKQIKNIMKRVSKENVKPVGRQIGKLSHCAPGFLFDYILLQIQIYDNLIGPVVDSLKYLTSLSFDCLGYCLIEALASADRDRFKHDGTSISLWLQSLASFSGAIYKKYNMELSGLLQFVANQLKSQKSLDLLILKEIVQKMAGVESAEEMTNEQLSAMSGGELLRGEAGYFSQVRNTKKSSQRLKDALSNNDLAVGICLLMAQQKHCVIYRETAQHHLKLVGKLYDQCQDTLVQFGTFLGSTYSVDEYVERLPSIIAMLQEYHINADVAFFLARPMFTHQINQKYDQLRKADPNAKKLTTSQKLQKYLEATNLIMNPIVESVRPLHGPKVWEDISPQFLVTFWSLSMYDLQVPVESYQKEIAKLKQLSLQAADSKDSNASKNKKEQERYIALMDKLQDERKKQQEHVDKVLQRLQQQKDNWFLSRSAKSAKNETITQFLQLCLFPRCTFTALDALYCAKFVHTIHNLKAANFSTLLCYDRIFCDISYSVTSCTENEATRYGRFLCAMLDCVMRWHADQATFNRECANYPGFVTKFRVSNQFSEANDHVGYENYRHVCHKWHYKITKAIVFCLDSKDYMQIRNALIILMRILPHFPMLLKLAQIIERKVEKVREEEKHKRPDLFVIASSYIGQLKLRSSQIVKESDFHQVAERPVKTEPGTTAAAASAAATSATVANTLNGSSSSSTNVANNVAAAVKLENIKAETATTATHENSTAVTTTNNKQNNTSGSGGGGGSIEIKSEPREKPSKIIKLTKEPKESSSTVQIIEIKEDSAATGASNLRNTVADEYERQRERLHREIKKEERLREREQREQRDRERESAGTISESSNRNTTSSRTKREKRREERRGEESSTRYRIDQSPSVEIIDSTNLKRETSHHEYETLSRSELEQHREQRERIRERDLSSVSNESNGSLHHRSSEFVEYEKESKRRKLEASSSSKKHQQQAIGDIIESSKKERSTKTKERKEKLTEEEKDARRERKLGRKRERLEECGGSSSTTTTTEHKRRREAQNGGDDDIRERDKYHAREKSSHERSHEKYERGSSTRDDRQYASLKSSRSRVDY